MNSVATIIRDQITELDRMAFFAWGSGGTLVAGENNLTFRSQGQCRWKGYITVHLNGRDLYDIQFRRYRKFALVEDVWVRDVYAEDLVRIIDEKVQ